MNCRKSNNLLRFSWSTEATRDQDNQVAIFRGMKSLPATVTTINFVLWFGLKKGASSELRTQPPIRSNVPTYLILPLRPSWRRLFYGHPTPGDDWAEYSDETIILHLQGERVEHYPSLWYFRALDVLIAAYVDDIVAAGPEDE